MYKTVYRILSLRNGTPVYRVYDYYQAQDLLLAVRQRWVDSLFWLEKKEREVRDGSE